MTGFESGNANLKLFVWIPMSKDLGFCVSVSTLLWSLPGKCRISHAFLSEYRTSCSFRFCMKGRWPDIFWLSYSHILWHMFLSQVVLSLFVWCVEFWGCQGDCQQDPWPTKPSSRGHLRPLQEQENLWRSRWSWWRWRRTVQESGTYGCVLYLATFGVLWLVSVLLLQ